ncbi:MAG: hypothetical protein WCS37_10160, partial [Chloroflexota bacterium]
MSQNIELVLPSTTIQVTVGESLDLELTLINNSGQVDRFELKVNEVDPSWFEFEEPEIMLYPDQPGNEAPVRVKLNIPLDAVPSSYSPILEVVSNNTQAVVVSQPFILLVRPLKKIIPQEIVISPQVQHTTQKVVHYQLDLKNNLGESALLNLLAEPETEEFKLILQPPVVEMAPESTTKSSLEVRFWRRNWFKPDQTYTFAVGIENSSIRAEGTLVQSCAVPWLRLLLLTPTLLASALLAPVLMMGLLIMVLWPSLLGLEAQPSNCVTYNPSTTATLQMNGSNTNLVVTRPDGSQTRLVEQGELLPGIFASLVSVSPDGRAVAYVTARNEGLDNADIYVMNVNTQTKQRIANAVPNGTSLWTTRPVWDARGSQLGYVVRNGTNLELWAVNLSDNRAHKLANSVPLLRPDLFYGEAMATGSPLCWSENGKRLIIRSSQNPTKQTEVAVTNNQIFPDLDRPIPTITPKNQKAQIFNFQAQNVKEPGPAPLRQGECFVNTTSQNDPQWRDQAMLGGGKISEQGCPLIAAAMMLNFYKTGNSGPSDLNSCLNKLNSTNPNSSFDWSVLSYNCTNSKLQAQRNRFDWSILDRDLSTGRPALVGLIGSQQVGIHWVVVLSGSRHIASTYRVNDPWDGTNYKTLEYFISKGYQPNVVVSFLGNEGSSCTKDLTESTDKSTPNFQLLNPDDGKAYNQPVLVQYQSSGTTPKLTLTNLSNGPDGSTEQTPILLDPQHSLIQEEGFYKLVMEDGSEEVTTTTRITSYFTIDKTPPLISADFGATLFESDSSPNGNRVARGSVSLQLNATDNLSGIASIGYRINGAELLDYNLDAAAKPIQFTAPGDYVITFKAVDGAGNISTDEKDSASFTIILPPPTPDPNAPTPLPTLAPTAPPEDVAATAAAVAAATAAALPTPTVVPPGVLAAVPAQVTFDANLDSNNVQLINTGAGPANWIIQPPTGPAVTFLKFAQAAGNVPAAGTASLLVGLKEYNLTNAPITANFNISYNNGAALIPITVIINPQPTPSVQFISPVSGPINNKVEIKLGVTSNGLAKPTAARFTAKFTDQPGGVAAEKPLAGEANLGNNWTISWDVSALPPQTPIDLSGKICWTSDDASCLKIEAGVAGLSIAKPAAIITLNPDSPKLAEVVNVTSEVTGIVDHILYSYTYKPNPTDAAMTVALTEKGTSANKYTVKWDTAAIPPQTGIKMDAKVCWGADDNNPNVCTTPTNTLPPLQVEQPTISLTTDPATLTTLPISVTLVGTIGKLYNPGGAVFIEYTYIPAGGTVAQTATSAPANLNPTGSGAASWSVDFNTASWPAQTVTFTPKVCWDGDKGGLYCYKAPPVNGTIPPFMATFVTPASDISISGPVSLTVSATPTARIDKIKYFITYTPFASASPVEAPLSTVATSKNNFTYNFDPVALGLKPDQKLVFKLQACAGEQCGVKSEVLRTLTIPAIKLNSTAINYNPALGANSTLSSNETVGGLMLEGYGVSKISFSASYRTNPRNPISLITNTITIPFSNSPIPIGALPTFKWNTGNIPPQESSTIQLSATGCWGTGATDLEQKVNCLPLPTDNIYAIGGSLNIAEPRINSVALNGSSTGPWYDPGLVANPNYLPIAVDDTSPLPKVNLQTVAIVNSSSVSQISWSLDIVNGATTVNSSPVISISNNQINNLNLAATTPVSLDLAAIKNSFPTTVLTNTNTTLLLKVSPIWKSGSTSVIYTDTTNVKVIYIKLVSLTVQVQDGSRPDTQLAPGPVDLTASLMMSRTTSLTVKLNSNPKNTVAATVRRVYFDVTVPGTTSQRISNSSGPKTATSTDADNLIWKLDWDHIADTPKIEPQSKVIIGWWLCSTTLDDSGCTYSSTSGVFAQNKNNPIILGGIKYGFLSTLTNYFPSTFQVKTTFISATVGSVTTGTTPPVGQVRLIAYPTSTTPDMTSAVVLKVRPLGATDTNTDTATGVTAITYSVYWPDETPAPSVGTTPSTLAGQLVNGGLTIAAQYCTDATSNLALNSSSCSDWTGEQTFKQTENILPATSSWLKATATTKALQAAIVVWQPYTGKYDLTNTRDPYNDWLQRVFTVTASPIVTGVNVTRTLTIKVIPVTGYTITLPVKLGWSLSTDSNVTYLTSPYPSRNPPSCLLTQMCNWATNWNFGSTYLSSLDYKLRADVSLSGPTSGAPSTYAEVLTHGYKSSPGGPIGGSPIVTATTTPTITVTVVPTDTMGVITPTIVPTYTMGVITPTIVPTDTMGIITPTIVPTDTMGIITPTVVPTDTLTPTVVPTDTLGIITTPPGTPTFAPTDTPTPTLVPTDTPTPTPVPTDTPTPVPTDTPTPVPTDTP